MTPALRATLARAVLNAIFFHDYCDGYLNTGSMKRAVRRRDTLRALGAQLRALTNIFTKHNTDR